MVVNRYQIIKALGSDFEDLVILDIVTPKILSWLVCYEAYLNRMKADGCKQNCMRAIAEGHNITQRTLYKIITFMETG